MWRWSMRTGSDVLRNRFTIGVQPRANVSGIRSRRCFGARLSRNNRSSDWPDARPARPGLREHGVYLITGAFGAIGLHLAAHLAASVQARLVLVGRSPLPPRAEWNSWITQHGPDDRDSRRIAAVRGLEGQGAEVLVVAADVADEKGTPATVEHPERD